MVDDNNSQTIKDFPPIQKAEDLQIRVAIKNYKGKEYVDIREWWKPEDKNSYLPTKKGITISTQDTLDLLNDFAAQINEIVNFLENEGENKPDESSKSSE